MDLDQFGPFILPVCIPEGRGALKLDDVRLRRVQGHQAALKVFFNGVLRDEGRLHIPETTAQLQAGAAGSNSTPDVLKCPKSGQWRGLVQRVSTFPEGGLQSQIHQRQSGVNSGVNVLLKDTTTLTNNLQ